MDEKEIKPKLSSYDYNNIISSRMISNFRTILEKNPEGILASELPDKYCVSGFLCYFINIFSVQDIILINGKIFFPIQNIQVEQRRILQASCEAQVHLLV